MPKQRNSKAADVCWDLTDLYTGIDDKKISLDLDLAVTKAEEFHHTYYGKIAHNNFAADSLLGALQQLEQIYTIIHKTKAYAFLAFSADTINDGFNALNAKAQEVVARVQNLVLFFDLEIQKIEKDKIDLFYENDTLQGYRHYLEGVRIFTPYTLSEKEEQIINKKNLSGKDTFVNFFQEYTSSFSWEIEVEGTIKTLTSEGMRHLLRDSDPTLRERAKRAYDGRYGENQIIFSNVFNAIVKDHAVETEMRGYANPDDVTHIHNRIPREIVENMMHVTSENYSIAQDYYTLKAKLLDMPKLKGSDLIAPIIAKREIIPFDDGKAMILAGLERFSPEFSGYAKQMFDNHWIDAEIRPNKRGGAYCYGIVPGLHPYILTNYNDDLDNVYTLAHELGHGIHDFLAGRKQTLFNYHPPLVTAETASVFAEMLLTEKLLSEVKDRDMRIAILTGKLEDLIGTIHTQNYYTRFELDAHLAGSKERLSSQQLCELWQKRRDEMFGHSVGFLPEQKWYWAAIPHFIHTRFYCYAYTFGALMVLTLFNQYKEEGNAFVPRFIKILEAGGSQTPEELMTTMGLDIRKPDFWEKGFSVMRSMLAELKSLVAS